MNRNEFFLQIPKGFMEEETAMGFSLTNHFSQNITLVPNIFIDTYMPQANGSFVKVYLCLLRQLSQASPALTVENMADMLSNTEADVIRALRYWEKQNVLSITEAGGKIIDIALLPLPAEKTGENHLQEQKRQKEPAVLPSSPNPAAPTKKASPPQTTDSPQAADTPQTSDAEAVPPVLFTLPERHTYSPLQAEALKKDSEIESCLSMVEAMLGTTLGDAHMQLILYLMSDLGFSLDLVITLYETALSRGKSRPRYIETIALDWAKKGIRTSREAQEEVSSFNGIYKTISNALGIKRALAPAEKTIIDKWQPYHFSNEILEEACARTVLQSGDTNLNYTAKILADWHKKGVSTLQDIADCDKSYYRIRNTATNKNTSAKRKKNSFQNFPQREYSKDEFADLEKQLLH